MSHTFLVTLGLVFLLLTGCMSGGDEKILKFECEEQNSGEHCNKLGLKRDGEEALRYFRMGCEKQSTVSCISLAERTSDPAEALRVLKQACQWKNPTACSKAEALSSVSTAAELPLAGDKKK